MRSLLTLIQRNCWQAAPLRRENLRATTEEASQTGRGKTRWRKTKDEVTQRDECGAVNYVLRHDEVEWLSRNILHVWVREKHLEGGICCTHIPFTPSFWKSCSVTETSSTLRRLNEFRLPGTCVKKNWTISVISKKRSVLVSSVRTGHRYGYSKESLYQQSPVLQGVISGSWGPGTPSGGQTVSGKPRTSSHRSWKRHKANTNSKMCCFAYNFDGICFLCVHCSYS